MGKRPWFPAKMFRVNHFMTGMIAEVQGDMDPNNVNKNPFAYHSIEALFVLIFCGFCLRVP